MNKAMPALLLLGLASSALAQESTLVLKNAMELTPENPLTEVARKKNGKFKKRFKIPYRALVDYFKYASEGMIIENPNTPEIKDIDQDVIHGKEVDSLNFFVSLAKQKAYPTVVLNPHTVSELFVVDPVAYATFAGADDFLDAKKKVYGAKSFDKKKVRYSKEMVHLEDWRSLNHPPVMDLGEDLTIWDKELTPIDYDKVESVFFKPEVQQKLDAASSSELTFGNKLHLLENGDSYDRKLVEVKKARKFILMAVMSFFCDKSSRQLEDLLIEKAKEGVDVKLIVEKVWTRIAMNSCLNRMIKGGIDVSLANDLLKRGDAQALFHDKFMVIDENMVIAGGANIMASDNISTGYNHMNRDNDVVIEGPMTADAILGFVDIYKQFENKRNRRLRKKDGERVKEIAYYEELANQMIAKQKQDGIRGPAAYAQKLSDVSTRMDGVCRFMNQSPSTDKYKISKVYIEMINHSESKLNMTNGNTFYFDLPEHKEKERNRDTWNKRLYRAMFAATERGVKLDIIGNGIDGGYGEASNMFKRGYLKNRYKVNPINKTVALLLADWMDHMAAKKNQPYLEFLASVKNTRAWAHFQYMHSKKFQVDRIVSAITSYNLDEWSADKAHESAVICMDKKLNQQLERSFLLDLANSTPAYKDTKDVPDELRLDDEVAEDFNEEALGEAEEGDAA